MRKAIKIFVASMMVVVVMVVSVACSTREHIAKFYNSKEDFVADFGIKLEKKKPEDVCCVFDDGVIQSSVEEVLKCEIGDRYYRAWVIFYRSIFGLSDRYEYESFRCTYMLLRQNVVIGELWCEAHLTGWNYKDEYELLDQIVVDGCEIGVYQPIEESKGRKEFFATFDIENTFNYIKLLIYDEYTREVFTCTEFVLLIEPIIKYRKILK